MSRAVVSIDVFNETYRCAFFVEAAILVRNESFTNCVKLPYLQFPHSWHNLHHKHQNLFRSDTNFPICLASLLSFLCLSDLFVSLTQGMYIIRLTIHVPLFLCNLTHIKIKVGLHQTRSQTALDYPKRIV